MSHPRRPRRLRACTAGTLVLLSVAVPGLAGAAPVEYAGACDASAAVAVARDTVVVANDEDNRLRIYRTTGGNPVAEQDLASFLARPDEKKKKEADLEGAARVGAPGADDTLVYWIASHGRNKDGEQRPQRHRLFATRLGRNGDDLAIATHGHAYADLLADLIAAPATASLDLATAATKAPEAPGGLNIEGLAATPEGHLLIGFRSPIPGGKALIVPLTNPRAVVERGERVAFAAPILLDLGGRGIRSLEYVETTRGYYVVAGPPDDATSPSAFALYTWSGSATSAPTRLLDVDLAGLSPEALVALPENATGVRLLLLSDDGARCKNLPEGERAWFRGATFDVPQPAAPAAGDPDETTLLRHR